jgi:hypothetical protein
MNQLEKFIERSSQNAFSYIADGAVARQDVLGASSVVEVLFVPKLALALKDITDNPDMMTSYEKRIYQCHYLLRRAFEIHNDLHKMEIGAPEVGGNIGSPKVVSAGPVPEVGQVKQ